MVPRRAQALFRCRARIVKVERSLIGSVSNVANRLTEVLEVIAPFINEPADDASLGALARRAHFSRFALHRTVRDVLGETPQRYVSRVRLERAASALLSSGRTVVEIAFDHGYASHEVFTRAFRRRFGAPPTVVRERGLLGADEPTSIRRHAELVASTSPCIGIYRISLQPRPRKATDVKAEIVTRDVPELRALVMRRRISRDGVAEALSACLPAVFGYAQESGLAFAGPPFARYPETSMASLVIECGMPVVELPETPPEGDIEALIVPAGRAVVALHRGPYEGLPEAHIAVENYLQKNGLVAAGPPWESYITDPGDHPDPATWETEVVQPIS